MKKVLLFLASLLLFVNNVGALDLNINSNNAFVYNLTEDKIMYEKNAYNEIKVASMTKIMTAILVIENNTDLNKKITIKDEDLRDMYEYTTTGFQPGDKVTIRELLYGILLKSGSDAVNAAVRVTTTTEKEFISLMNQKAKELNLTHTYFSNPIGKDEDNYSSVSDMAKIMQYCLKNKDFKEIVSTNMYKVKNLDLQINGPLYNSLSKYSVDTSIIKGSKTGFTSLAKHSMVSYSENKDTTYIVVTAYADNYTLLLQDNKNIYEYFFNNYNYKDYNINFNIDVEDGEQDNYNVNVNTKLFLKNDYDKNLLTYEYNGKETINFMLNKGDKLGSIYVYYDKELIKTIDINLEEAIKYKLEAYAEIIIIAIVVAVNIIIGALIILYKKRVENPKPKKVKKPKKTSKLEERKVKKKKEELESKLNVFIKEEDSIDKKINILHTTTNVNLFFDTLKGVTCTTEDKAKYEHEFIDRCFQSIDFKNREDLEDLYTKFTLYKGDMESSTIKYYTTLFKYCIEEYIKKK